MGGTWNPCSLPTEEKVVDRNGAHGDHPALITVGMGDAGSVGHILEAQVFASLVGECKLRATGHVFLAETEAVFVLGAQFDLFVDGLTVPEFDEAFECDIGVTGDCENDLLDRDEFRAICDEGLEGVHGGRFFLGESLSVVRDINIRREQPPSRGPFSHYAARPIIPNYAQVFEKSDARSAKYETTSRDRPANKPGST